MSGDEGEYVLDTFHLIWGDVVGMLCYGWAEGVNHFHYSSIVILISSHTNFHNPRKPFLLEIKLGLFLLSWLHRESKANSQFWYNMLFLHSPLSFKNKFRTLKLK